MLLQIGISDKSILRDFHPDAEDLYNVTMDLSTVCKDLKDRDKRMPRRVMPPQPCLPHATLLQNSTACNLPEVCKTHT